MVTIIYLGRLQFAQKVDINGLSLFPEKFINLVLNLSQHNDGEVDGMKISTKILIRVSKEVNLDRNADIIDEDKCPLIFSNILSNMNCPNTATETYPLLNYSEALGNHSNYNAVVESFILRNCTARLSDSLSKICQWIVEEHHHSIQDRFYNIIPKCYSEQKLRGSTKLSFRYRGTYQRAHPFISTTSPLGSGVNYPVGEN